MFPSCPLWALHSISGLPDVIAGANGGAIRGSLRHLTLRMCGGWPEPLGRALQSCSALRHLTLPLIVRSSGK